MNVFKLLKELSTWMNFTFRNLTLIKNYVSILFTYEKRNSAIPLCGFNLLIIIWRFVSV